MDLDINLFRVIGTVVVLLVFLGIVWWAYGSKQKQRFLEDGNIPFKEGNEFGSDNTSVKGS
jgi:cytochrome c oxidase cbb3-type subunit 4